ncbi:ABC transporter substrate-binding protein [Cohnella sp. WQ 127256]|uniref:ABC transporter substrate-binding protein n=1 Tax=Cohnella sp. WQ 127256 TaxID=2938790 RepID=UPI0021198418|nr:ABC transporter substrate-binding protein [Cohnella sp. WQ 127256]
MRQAKKFTLALSVITLMALLLLACGNNSKEQAVESQPSSANAEQTGTPAPSAPATEDAEEAEPATRKYTDYMGRESEIPVSPKRIIFTGETFSDLLALGVEAVGTDKEWNLGTVYGDRLANVEDVGFPINLEKTLNLQPDLILVANTDEKLYEQLSKIAPTVTFDTFAPLNERLPLLGDLVGKKEEAEKWLAEYNAKADAMWKELEAAGMKPGETASVFTYYPGDRLFIMARAGLSQVLYEKNGFKATPPIQKVLDANSGFEQISLEALPEYAGDRIFILTPAAEEAQKSTDEMLKSKIWSSLPAVKNNHVYTIDIIKSGSDAITREWMLQELPKMFAK